MIKLDEFYTIEPDISSWNLRYEKVGPERNAKGELKVSKDMTFHPNIKHALETYADKVLKPCKSIGEVLAKIVETQELIRTVVAEQLGKMEKGE